VGVSVDERQVTAAAIASRQTVTGRHGPRVHAPSLGRQPVAERIGEEREASLVALLVRLRCSLVGESADRGPEPVVIPPEAVESRIRLDDALALFDRGRQRPG